MNIYNSAKKLMPSSDFARKTILLVGGTAGGQLALLAAAPILTRLYSPESFGLYGIYMALLGVIAVVACFRYELAIPLAKEREEALDVLYLCFFGLSLVTLITAMICALWGSEILFALSVSQLNDYLWLFPVGVFSIGTYRIFYHWALREQSFREIAVTKVNQSLVTIFIQISSFKFLGAGLVAGQVIGQSVGVIKLAMPAIPLLAGRKFSFGRVKGLAKRYQRFPIYSTWGALLGTLGTHLPTVVIAVFFGAGAAGVYGLAQRVLTMPVTLISGAVSNVFFSKAARDVPRSALGKMLAGVHNKVILMGVPGFFLLGMYGADFFEFVFGREWREAGVLAAWMAPWLYAVFVVSPVSVLYEILEKQLQGVVFQVLLFVSRIGGLLVGAYYNDLIMAIMFFSLSSFMCWIGLLAWLVRITDADYLSMIKNFVFLLVIVVLIFLPSIAAKWFLGLGAVWFACLVAGILVFLSFYYMKWNSKKSNDWF